MSALKSSEEKKLSQNSETEKLDNWLRRIDYWKIIQKAGLIFWENKKRLVIIAILLTITGGQAVTFNSSLSGNIGGGGSGVDENQSTLNPEISDWNKTLDEIENREQLKSRVRDFIESKQKFYGAMALAVVLSIIILVVGIVVFLLNCHFHLLFINTTKYLNAPTGKTVPEKNVIKEKIKGRWKDLALMRVVFGLIYLGSLVLFILPTVFFIWQKSWALAITFGGFSLMAIFVVFVVVSYVFRYSLFYLALTRTSIKKSIDCGYELFSKFWKESVLASLVNFALGVIAAIAIIFTLFASLIVLLLVAVVVGFVIYLVMGLAHAEGIAIGVGIVLVLIPLIIIGVVLAAVWQGFVVIFWYLIFNEIAGCKKKSCQEIAETETAKTKPDLAKTKKPATKPVIQKEEK